MDKFPTGKVVGIFVLAIVVLFAMAVIGSALNLITIPWLRFDSQVQMNRDIIAKTYDATNAVYNYHWFKQTSGDIKAAQQNIDVAKTQLADFETFAGDHSKWSFDDKTEDARLRSVYTGLQTYTNGLIADYNAHAKEADRSIFQDNLPLFFNIQ